MSREVRAFVNRLADKGSVGSVFNPWSGYDPVYDVSKKASEMRRENLIHFLDERTKTARVLLLGEALGYQGGKFSGIAMMSERILGGRRVPDFPREGYRSRMSDPNGPNLSDTVRRYGFNEPTATVVWGAVLKNEIDPRHVVTWNIFPFHPYKKGDTLSNRTPKKEEIKSYLEIYRIFRRLFPNATVFAVGKEAGKHLNLSIDRVLRHPANGGAEIFRRDLRNKVLKHLG